LVDWDQLRLDVCVTTKAQTTCMLQDGESQKREINPSKGQQTNWEKENLVC